MRGRISPCTDVELQEHVCRSHMLKDRFGTLFACVLKTLRSAYWNQFWDRQFSLEAHNRVRTTIFSQFLDISANVVQRGAPHKDNASTNKVEISCFLTYDLVVIKLSLNWQAFYINICLSYVAFLKQVEAKTPSDRENNSTPKSNPDFLKIVCWYCTPIGNHFWVKLTRNFNPFLMHHVVWGVR